ncbi:MAG: hypothetical protein HUU25_11065 [Candidatus Sumerlaeia bacterium]|nr:hypothetical protein [Candidatus Sumerlaeia bacterium]
MSRCTHPPRPPSPASVPIFNTLCGISAAAFYGTAAEDDLIYLDDLAVGHTIRMHGGSLIADATQRWLGDIDLMGTSNHVVGVQGVGAAAGYLSPEASASPELGPAAEVFLPEQQFYRITDGMGVQAFFYANSAIANGSSVENAYGILVGGPPFGSAVTGERVENAYGIYIQANDVSPEVVEEDWSLVAEGDSDFMRDVFVGRDSYLGNDSTDQATVRGDLAVVDTEWEDHLASLLPRLPFNETDLLVTLDYVQWTENQESTYVYLPLGLQDDSVITRIRVKHSRDNSDDILILRLRRRGESTDASMVTVAQEVIDGREGSTDVTIWDLADHTVLPDNSYFVEAELIADTFIRLWALGVETSRREY